MIDELERVRNFRDAEPPPSEQATKAARAALAHAIAAESERASRPARLLPIRSRRGLAILAGAVAAAVILVGVFGSGGSPTGPSSAAAAVLQRLARVVASQSLTPGPGQYLYADSTSAYGAYDMSPHPDQICEVLTPRRDQSWIAADGSGLVRETTERAAFTSPADRAACRARHDALLATGTTTTWYAPRCLSLGPTSDWRSLSRNPRILLRQMRRIDGGSPTPAEDFVHVGDFLRGTDAPPRVRAELYRAAALIPGIRLLGWVRDHDGRRGLGIAITDTENRSTPELIFNSRTGELLGEQSTGLDSYWAVYLRQRIVNHIPSKAPAPLTPPCNGSGNGQVSRPVPGGTLVTGPPARQHQPHPSYSYNQMYPAGPPRPSH